MEDRGWAYKVLLIGRTLLPELSPKFRGSLYYKQGAPNGAWCRPSEFIGMINHTRRWRSLLPSATLWQDLEIWIFSILHLQAWKSCAAVQFLTQKPAALLRNTERWPQ